MSDKIESIRVGEKTYTINDPNSATQEELEKLRDTTSKLEEDIKDLKNSTCTGENSVFKTDITLVDTPVVIGYDKKVAFHLGYQTDLIQAYKDGFRYVRFKGTNGPYSNVNLCGGVIINKEGAIESQVKESPSKNTNWFTLPITENSSYLKASYQRLITTSEVVAYVTYKDGFEPEYVELVKDLSSINYLHQLFTSIGAIYNPTDEVKERKLITLGDKSNNYMEFKFNHLPRHWYLNGLGDLTDEEMLSVYNAPHNSLSNSTYAAYDDCRTFIFKGNGDQLPIQYSSFFRNCCHLRSLIFTNHFYPSSNSRDCFSNTDLVYLLPDRTFGNNNCYGYNGIDESCFYKDPTTDHPLEEIRVYLLRANADFRYCPNLSKTSLLYMINCSDATKAIVITLHPNAYSRLVDDADVVQALNSANEKLSSAGGSINLVTI